MSFASHRPALVALAAAAAQAHMFSAGAQQILDEHLIKARLLERMVGFVAWPPSKDRGTAAPFRVGFFGRTGIAREYAKLARGNAVGNRRIEVGYIGARDNLEAYDLVFIAETELRRAQEISTRLAGKPVLTVCDGREGCAKGVILSMFTLEEKIRYDVNLGRARQCGFAIHSQILHYAEKVHDGGLP
jgi:hypothetical protein